MIPSDVEVQQLVAKGFGRQSLPENGRGTALVATSAGFSISELLRRSVILYEMEEDESKLKRKGCISIKASIFAEDRQLWQDKVAYSWWWSR